MRYVLLLTVCLSIACSQETTPGEAEATEFAVLARAYQESYVNGSENCERIIEAMDDSIAFSENGTAWSKPELEEFCPHLPQKNVVSTFNDQRLLTRELGYDFVTQLYIRERGDTMRETASRIWQRIDGRWKITQMNNLLHKAAADE